MISNDFRLYLLAKELTQIFRISLPCLKYKIRGKPIRIIIFGATSKRYHLLDVGVMALGYDLDSMLGYASVLTNSSPSVDLSEDESIDPINMTGQEKSDLIEGL